MAAGEMRWAGARARSRDYVVERLRDPDQIRQMLEQRVEYAAYAIGQLEPGLFERTKWYRGRGESGTGLVLHSRGGLGDATFVMGDPDAVYAVLSIHPGTPTTYATCQPVHLERLGQVYRLANQQPMIRMGVSKKRFAPANRLQTVPLSGLDIRRINALYSTDGAASYYAPEHIDAGLYRGMVVDGRLVSIAGTHVMSPQERIAVVGNVFTHPAYRGRGFATAVTSAVTEALFEFCDHVVLTVDPNNRPAVQAYNKLGYLEVCELVEASAARRDPAGIGAALRRFRARIRGRRYAGSFVTIR